jgi:hypothetical protein
MADKSNVPKPNNVKLTPFIKTEGGSVTFQDANGPYTGQQVTKDENGYTNVVTYKNGKLVSRLAISSEGKAYKYTSNNVYVETKNPYATAKATPTPKATPTAEATPPPVAPPATPTPKATPSATPKATPSATPTPTPTSTAAATGLEATWKALFPDTPYPGLTAPVTVETKGKTETPPKSGNYVRTYTTTNVPPESTLKDNINNYFQKFYGRDASESEVATLLPEFKKQYTTKDGKSKSTVTETYKNGQLISTSYLTADGADPKLWVENEVKQKLLSGTQNVNTLNIPEGPSGKYFVALKNFAADNGLTLSDSAATRYANNIVGGVIDENTAFNTLRESAANAFPSLGDKIKSGIDLRTLADPYIQSMSNILEIPDNGIDLFDPKIRSALAYTLPDGKVGTKSIYDFEKDLRQDPRWQFTNNARSQAADVATQVLKDFGFRG